MFEFLLQGLAIGLSAGVLPGPLLMLFIARAMQDGWRRTLPASFAPLLSDGPIVLVVLFVLSRLSDGFLDGLRVAGGIFLLYLAWQAVRSLNSLSENSPAPARGPVLETLRAAALLNLLNPNPYIFWSTILGPTFILGWRRAPQIGLAYLAGFYGAMIGCFMIWIAVAGSIGAVSRPARKVVAIASGFGMAGFGLYQILAGLGLV